MGFAVLAFPFVATSRIYGKSGPTPLSRPYHIRITTTVNIFLLCLSPETDTTNGGGGAASKPHVPNCLSHF
jgi:hypothetical protein